MKFDCGASAEQKWEAKKNKLKEWHKWFAWYPVRVCHNECRWLEWVHRRGEYLFNRQSITTEWEWEYKPIEGQQL